MGLGFSQTSLERSKGHLSEIAVGAVRRQETQRGAAGPEDGGSFYAFVAGKVVENDRLGAELFNMVDGCNSEAALHAELLGDDRYTADGRRRRHRRVVYRDYSQEQTEHWYGNA